MDNNVYKKVGRRYEPIGVMYRDNDYLTEGFWLVTKRKGCKSIENVDYYSDKFGLTHVGIPELDLDKYAEAAKLKNALLCAKDKYGMSTRIPLSDLLEKWRQGGMSVSDFADEIVKIIVNSEEFKNKNEEV